MNALQWRRACSASLILCFLAGCTWVPLTSAGEYVQVIASSADLTECERVGAVSAQTRARIWLFGRSDEKVAEELRALARNDASEMGADYLVAESAPSLDGRQRFAAYRCLPSAANRPK